MTTGQIDLKKNPEVAEVVQDLPLGTNITIYATIKNKDEQTLEYTIEEVESAGESAESSSDAEFADDEDDEDDDSESTRP
jgi:hypothetical protein